MSNQQIQTEMPLLHFRFINSTPDQLSNIRILKYATFSDVSSFLFE